MFVSLLFRQCTASSCWIYLSFYLSFQMFQQVFKREGGERWLFWRGGSWWWKGEICSFHEKGFFSEMQRDHTCVKHNWLLWKLIIFNQFFQSKDLSEDSSMSPTSLFSEEKEREKRWICDLHVFHLNVTFIWNPSIWMQISQLDVQSIQEIIQKHLWHVEIRQLYPKF